jgi:hypothetical protein
MKERKGKERKMKILTIPLILVLVVVGTQHAFATNESSYKWGYEHGKSEWFSCDVGGDCHNAVVDCHSSSTVPASSPPNTQVTNETACVHGFIHAFNRYCKPTEAGEYHTCPTTWKIETFYSIGTTFANGTDIEKKGYWVPNNG